MDDGGGSDRQDTAELDDGMGWCCWLQQTHSVHVGTLGWGFRVSTMTHLDKNKIHFQMGGGVGSGRPLQSPTHRHTTPTPPQFRQTPDYTDAGGIRTILSPPSTPAAVQHLDRTETAHHRT